MTTTPPETSQPHGPGPDSGPRVGWDDIRDLGRIRRSVHDRRVSGVAAGLAHHLDIDPVIVRVAFVVLSFFGGVGLILYVGGWLLIPQEGKDWAKVALDRRSRTVALSLVGILGLVLLLSHGWWGAGFPWAVLVIVAVIAVLATQLPQRGGDQHAVPPPQTPGSTPADASATATDAGPYIATDAGPFTGPPAYVAPPVQPRPVNPRKRGPILFWFALALMAVSVGALGVADLAGADVAPSAYPALILALSGVVLVVGAFFGRAGGIILVGFIAVFATIGSTVADRWDPHKQIERPLTAADVQASYQLDMGDLVVDLSGVRDLQALDGRTIHVSGGIGRLAIQIPPGVTVISHSHVSGPGGISVFGPDTGGVNTEVDSVHRAAAPGAPTLTIDADLHVGAIDLSTRSY